MTWVEIPALVPEVVAELEAGTGIQIPLLPKPPGTSTPPSTDHYHYMIWKLLTLTGGAANVYAGPFNQYAWEYIANDTMCETYISLNQISAAVVASFQLVTHAINAQYQSLLSQIGSVASGTGQSAAAVAQNLFNAANANADRLYNAAVAHTNAEAAAVTSLAETLYNESVAHTNVVGGHLTTLAENLYNASVAHTNAVGAGVQANLNHAQASLQSNINAVAGQAAANLHNTATVLEMQISNGVSAAEGFALGLVPGTIAQAATKVETQLQPQLDKIKTDIDTCLEPLCDTVTPNANNLGKLGKLIKDLEGLAAGGLLAGLLIAAVKDPADTAAVVVDSTGWMTELGVSAAKAAGAAL